MKKTFIAIIILVMGWLTVFTIREDAMMMTHCQAMEAKLRPNKSENVWVSLKTRETMWHVTIGDSISDVLVTDSQIVVKRTWLRTD